MAVEKTSSLGTRNNKRTLKTITDVGSVVSRKRIVYNGVDEPSRNDLKAKDTIDEEYSIMSGGNSNLEIGGLVKRGESRKSGLAKPTKSIERRDMRVHSSSVMIRKATHGNRRKSNEHNKTEVKIEMSERRESPIPFRIMNSFHVKKEQIDKEESSKYEDKFSQLAVKPRHTKLLNFVNQYGKNKFKNEQSLFNTETNGLDEIQGALEDYKKKVEIEMELPVCKNLPHQWFSREFPSRAASRTKELLTSR